MKSLNQLFIENFKIVLKSKRDQKLRENRAKILDSLQKDFEGMILESQKNENSDLNDFLIQNINNYKIKIYPQYNEKGYLTVENNMIKFQYNKQNVFLKVDNICNIKCKVMFVQQNNKLCIYMYEILQVKSYNYKALDPKVQQYLLRNHFYSNIIYQDQMYTIQFLSIKLLDDKIVNEIIQKKLNFYKIQFIPTKEEIEEFALFDIKTFEQKTFKINLKFKKGFFITSDRVEIIHCSEVRKKLQNNQTYQISLSINYLNQFKTYMLSLKNCLFQVEDNFQHKQIRKIKKVQEESMSMQQIFDEIELLKRRLEFQLNYL